MKPAFFKSAADFRKWLQKNHATTAELLVGFYKRDSGKPSMTWSESVDQALCFGWIDGVRRSLGPDAYTIRFTPRRPGSIWSRINIDKVNTLTGQGLMRPAGDAAFARRDEKKSRIYAYERETAELSGPWLELLKKNKAAWGFFQAQAPWYRKLIGHYVMNAKQEVTKQKRIERVIAASAEGKRL